MDKEDLSFKVRQIPVLTSGNVISAANVLPDVR